MSLLCHRPTRLVECLQCWLTEPIVRGNTCRCTRTHYPASEPTSLCLYSLIESGGDYCLTPVEQLFSYIMVWTSYSRLNYDTRFVLDQHSYVEFYSVRAHWANIPRVDMSPHPNVILIPSFALTPSCCVLSGGQAAISNCISHGLNGPVYYRNWKKMLFICMMDQLPNVLHL